MLSTKGISTGSPAAKTLRPGNVRAKIYDISLLTGFNEGSYHLILNVESEPIGDGFEGFLINKDDESLGRFQGQIGRVRYSQYAFEDKEFTNGTKLKRDEGIIKALKTLAKALGVSDEIDSIEAETIEELVANSKKVLCNGVFIDFCLAGKEYQKGEYVNYDLFLPRVKGSSVKAYSDDPAVVVPFSEKDHIIALVKRTAPVDEFEAPTSDESKDFTF